MPFALLDSCDDAQKEALPIFSKKGFACMAVDQRVALDLDDLPMDVFELVDQGLVVESLTADHYITKMGASCSVFCSCCCS
jgi:hypothetical protein